MSLLDVPYSTVLVLLSSRRSLVNPTQREGSNHRHPSLVSIVQVQPTCISPTSPPP